MSDDEKQTTKLKRENWLALKIIGNGKVNDGLEKLLSNIRYDEQDERVKQRLRILGLFKDSEKRL